MKKTIVATSLSMEFANGLQALKDINISIGENEFVAIVGPSGCGKSTLLRIIAGLTGGFSGHIEVNESMRKKHLAFVFQEANLLPWRTVLSNVRLPLQIRKLPKQQHYQKSMEKLKLVGLEKFHSAYPQQLSGGMKMRVSLARALVTQPHIMLLDEPFGALDEITRQRLNEELLSIWEKEKWTALFVTHNITEAVFLSNRVLVFSDRPGTIVADIPIPFCYPRIPQIRTDVNFAKIVERISFLLRQNIYE